MPTDLRDAVRLGAGLAYLGLVAFLVAANMHAAAPDPLGPAAGGAERAAAMADLVLHYAYLPRLVMAILCGAALGLSGVILQQVLQNPLASPETLAVNGGAQLALTAGLLTAPAFHADHAELLAVAGAGGAWALIAAIAWRRRSDPITLILVGFIVAFALGAIASMMMMLHQEYLTSLFIWGAGSLVQDGWDDVRFLVPRLLACAALTALMVRPLLILGFGDGSASSLGIGLRLVRPLLLGTAVFLSASVAAIVGVIGFVGLAAPHLARAAGAERLGSRLIAAPVAGAGLVLMVDQLLQYFATAQATPLPTGAVTALLGAPLLIVLLRRTPSITLEGGAGMVAEAGRRLDAARPTLLAVALTLLAVLALALFVGRNPQGFTFAFETGDVLGRRLARVGAAAGAGLALGVAGCLVQRLFANAMASPEVLGIGGGVAVGIIVAMLLSPAADAGAQLGAGLTGALTVAAAILLLGGHRGFTPERLLLIGIAITALLNATTMLFLALGDPRIGQVLAWISGSTYRATPGLAITVLSIAFAGLSAAVPLGRWLDILPLGDEAVRGLGVPGSVARFVTLVLAALTTAAASMVVGPLSFVGLLAPHFASLAGCRRAGTQLVGAAGAGAALVVFADWAGRVVFAPTELPAGILSILIGTAAVTAFLVLRGSGRSR